MKPSSQFLRWCLLVLGVLPLLGAPPVDAPAAAAPGRIRVGLIRADPHGLYYAVLMDEHDPLLLQKPPVPAQPRPPYSWMRGTYHKVFYAPDDPTRRTAPFVGGFDIVKIWDEHRTAAEALARVLHGEPRVCDRFEEVSDGVDLVLVADCNYDGSDHLKLATPGLRKGVPTFVDKPFAARWQDAAALVELARERRVPVYSRSILSELPQVARFRDGLRELSEVQFGVVRGGGATLDGQVHAFATALAIFGGGVERVDAMGGAPLGHLLLSYGSRSGRPRDGVAVHCVSGGMSLVSGYFGAAFSERGARFSESFDSGVFVHGAVRIVEQLRDMVRTGRPPVSYEEQLEPIAIAEAARISQAEKRPVAIQAVTGAAVRE